MEKLSSPMGIIDYAQSTPMMKMRSFHVKSRSTVGYSNTMLIRIDSNRGTKEDEAGRYYLRYQYDKGITEFWGHHANSTYVDCDQGLVGIAK